MNTGHVKLYRKVMNSFVWTNPYMYKLWSLCLMKASYKNRKILFNGKEIQVSSGEFVTGRDALEKEFNKGAPSDQQIVGRTLWRWLKKFEKEEMLSIKSTTKYSVISIKNWDEYQSNDQQVSNSCPSSDQQVSTNKKEKKDKKDKNINNKTLSSQTRKARVYDLDSNYYQLAEQLFKQICQNQEIKEPNLQRWADDIRKMIEIDKRTEDQVSRMIDWSQKNSFWSANILSARKLREKYDTMAAQANREYKQAGTGYQRTAHKPIRTEPIPEWLDDPEGYNARKEAEIKRKVEVSDEELRRLLGDDGDTNEFW